MSYLTQAIAPRDHLRGAIEPQITLVEYGDYECAHCAHAQALTAHLLHHIGDHLLFVFRHFPLSRFHPYAINAALAAEAAGAQGEYWGMHECLFRKQDALELPSLMRYAHGLGLNLVRFSEDLENETYLDKVEADFRSGLRSGVNGTPTFFIDGQRFEGNWEKGALVDALITKLGDAPSAHSDHHFV